MSVISFRFWYQRVAFDLTKKMIGHTYVYTTDIKIDITV